MTHHHSDPSRHANRLAESSSPYLLQHAYHPVDWYPWCEEALEKARGEDKPIFLSVGYSACHWCHVMAHESFEDEVTAAILNEHFVNIKVDREERPDLDSIYMSAVQIVSGSGGWPMSVFLTPELKPFYAGTYFPPRDMYGRPGFKTVLAGVIETWRSNRDKIDQSAEQITGYIRQSMDMRLGQEQDVSPVLLERAAAELSRSFDSADGGFGPAPKFPSSPSIQVLLRYYLHSGDEALKEMALFTLRKMAWGGLYDQLGGGFHRYSVDAQWLVPHFEKMLYDNAQLADVYLEAFQLTGDALYERVARETLDYVLRDMRDNAGGFHSAEDADSEGQEGKFYLWTQEEIEGILGSEDARFFCAYYGVLPNGNFASHEPYHRGQNILNVPKAPESVARAWGCDATTLEARLTPLRETLLSVRSRRVRPGLDDKVLVSWNALIISALAHGYQVLEDPRYRQAAEEAAQFLLTGMVREGELQRAYRRGKAQFAAYLDDYAFLSVALIDLYEATFEPRWLEDAEALTRSMIARFWDEAEGGFYFTSEAHKDLIARNKPVYDGAEPSGNSMAVLALLRLGRLLDDRDFLRKGERLLRLNHINMSTSPRAVLKMLVALDFLLAPAREVVLVGNLSDPTLQAMRRAVHRSFVPNKVMAHLDPTAGSSMPLLAGKTLVDGKPATYVCRNYACEAPVTTAEGVAKILASEDATMLTPSE